MKPGILIAACAATFAMVCPTVAQAQDGGGQERVSMTVRYGDLDLTTDAGQDQLKRRIANSAEQVCGDKFVRDFAVRTWVRHCIKTATAGATRDVQLASAKSRSKSAKA